MWTPLECGLHLGTHSQILQKEEEQLQLDRCP